MRLTDNVYESKIQLTDAVELHVYCVKGNNYSVLIDSGVRSMFPSIVMQLREASIHPRELRFILHTHSHHDHIGCNYQLKQLTGCLIAAHAHYQDWHCDFEHHYKQFALGFPSIIPDSPELRKEVFDVLDGEMPVDMTIDEGVTFHLGGSTVLEAFAFPGHMKAELGFLEHGTRTLILGDTITGLDWPFFHSHLNVSAYRDSMRKIERLLHTQSVQVVLLSHFGVKTPEETLELTYRAQAYFGSD